MPYEVAGNAGAAINDNTGNFNGNDYVRMAGGGNPVRSACDCIRTVLCLMIVGGIVCTGFGVYFLHQAFHDTRGDQLASWSVAMSAWNSHGLATFSALNWTSNGKRLTGSSSIITPESFGETTWSDKKHSTPENLSSYKYSGVATCPGGKVPTDGHLPPCTINITARNGKLIIKQLSKGVAQQVGPRARHLELQGCSWYDSDWDHPMATVGMGKCNTQGPDYGPECSATEYLDSHGCPNDVIETTYWKQPWYTTLSQKPRFTYENGKCWDYTDCYCSGCGTTFKNDATKGYGFTGFGYYYGGRFIPFAAPLNTMTGNQRALQCKTYMDQISGPGWKCPASSVNLICFNAGGFPKPKCKSKCQAIQADPKPVYTPPHTTWDMWKYYDPYGHPHGSGIPFPTTTASCDWTETKTALLTKMTIATNDDGTAWEGGRWTSGTSFTTNTVQNGIKPFGTLPGNTTVEIVIVAKDGPLMTAAKITNGCTEAPHPDECFGLTQKQNLIYGFSFLGAGLVLLCGPICCFCMCMKAVSSMCK